MIIQELYRDAISIANTLCQGVCGTGLAYNSFKDLKNELDKLVLPAAIDMRRKNAMEE
jgi:hypothetical protein